MSEFTEAQIRQLRQLEASASNAAESGVPLSDAIAEVTSAYEEIAAINATIEAGGDGL